MSAQKLWRLRCDCFGCRASFERAVVVAGSESLKRVRARAAKAGWSGRNASGEFGDYCPACQGVTHENHAPLR